MDTTELSQRRRDLERLAEERGIDVEGALGELPRDEDDVMVAALATLLGLNVRASFDESIGLDEVARLSEERREGQLTPEIIEEYARQIMDARDLLTRTEPTRPTKRRGKGGS